MNPVVVPTNGVAVAANAFSKPHYSFKCWNTAADGTGTRYNPSDVMQQNGISSETGEITLYAQWEFIPIEMPLSGVDGPWGVVLAVALVAVAFAAAVAVYTRLGRRRRKAQVKR